MGLIGSNGILPIAPYLKTIQEQVGLLRFAVLPTVVWFNQSDFFLHALCALGVVFSILLIIGFAVPLATFALWLIYLSLVVAGREFMSFQWDVLLLEAGFLAVLLSPWRLKPDLSREQPPNKTVVFLFRWLAFRLMVSSGLVKLMSGDTSWRDLTALNYHYFTQPLPNTISWFVHQAPAWFQKMSTGIMFIVELIIPVLIFLPLRRVRHVSVFILIGFQILIFMTGNYCFFNVLSIAILMMCLDDTVFPERYQRETPTDQTIISRQWPSWILMPLLVLSLLVTSIQTAERLQSDIHWPKPLYKLNAILGPFRTFNAYGLFAVMTKTRMEIVVEGSMDGETWTPYEFKYKPGDLMRRPRQAAPHQPRLDWQMWFAALGTTQQNQWFINFCLRLLQGSEPVVGLIGNSPFPDRPPKYIRAVTYDYMFTTVEERKKTGAWWKRQEKGFYLPPIMLKG